MGTMGPMRRLFAIPLLAACLITASAGAAWSGPPWVTVELVSEGDAIAPGKTFWIGLRQTIAPGWHTYWSNPGDSGEAPQIDWTLPAGFAAAEISWPNPERLRLGPAMSYGYSNEVTLPIQMTAPANLVPGTRVTLTGRASWLVCEKECIPEEAPVSLSLPVVAGEPGPHPTGAPLIARARQAVPSPSPWPASFTATPEAVTFTVAARGLAPDRIAEVWFYPARWGAIDHAAPQQARVDARGITHRGGEGIASRSHGRAHRRRARADGAARRRGRAPGVRASGPLPQPRRRAAALLQAVGPRPRRRHLLNLMPCVLPVLSVKALGLDPARRRLGVGDAPARPCLRRGGAALLRRGGGNVARPPRGRRAHRLGIPAPVAPGGDPARVSSFRHGAGPVGCLRDRWQAHGYGAIAGRAIGLRVDPSSRARSPPWPPRPAPRRSWGRRSASR